jgi:hypothetical protein
MTEQSGLFARSIYYEMLHDYWDMFIKNLILSPPPLLVSKKMYKIMKARKPKVHYVTGSFLQAGLLPLLKMIVPENKFLDLIAAVYGL